MSTQNLQSAESRKINKSFFEGQSRVSYLTRDFLSVEGKVRKGEALAGLPLSPPPPFLAFLTAIFMPST